jgi:hypothetical protein
MRILNRVISRELLAQLLDKPLSSNLSRNRNFLQQARAIALSAHARGSHQQEQNAPAKAPASSTEKPQWERENRTVKHQAEFIFLFFAN